MTVTWLATYQRHAHTFEKVMAIFCLGLFVYALADWRGWLPFARGFEPLRMVFLSAALALQPIARLLQRRSMVLWFVLLAASMALLVEAFVVTA